MATATLSRPQVHTENWTTVFPTENCTETQSALFVKKLLAVSLSNITYLRAIFPESAFGDRCIEDLQLKILKDDTRCQGACQVVKWIRGCFDALDKKYLRQAILGIFVDPSNENSLIESYTYRFTYKEGEGTAMNVYRNDEEIASSKSKKCTVMLLRTLVILLQSLRPLPDDVMLTMKLYYYDEVTPADYEPPGFKPCTADNFAYDVETINVAIGDVNTRYHAVNLRMKTDKTQFSSGEIPDKKPSESEVDKTEMVTGPSQDLFFDSQSVKVQENVVKDVDMDTETVNLEAENRTKTLIGEDKIKSPDDLGVKCPCGSSVDDGLMVLCDECNSWQHAICFKLTEAEAVPDRHVCAACATSNPSAVATDPYLNMLPPSTIQGVCLWRRAIWLCRTFRRVSVTALASCLDVDVDKAATIFSRLDKEGFLCPATGNRSKSYRTVDNDRVQSDGVAKYLSSGIPARSQQSQSATPDISSQSLAIAATRVSQVDAVTERTKELKVTLSRNECHYKIQTDGGQNRKRAISVINNKNEFDVAEDGCSQENNNSAIRRPGVKRLKGSLVSPLMV